MAEETARCPHCFSEIDARATVCPFCRRDISPAASPTPPQVPTRRPGRGGCVIILLALIIAVPIISCLYILAAGAAYSESPAGQTAAATRAIGEQTATAVAIAMRGETATARWNVVLELTANAPTATPTPSKTPTSTPTSTPTATPTPSGSAVAIQNGNLRGGPGTHYPVVGTIQAGDMLPVFGRTADGWLQVDGAGAKWVASSLVNLDVDTTAVAIAQAIPPTPTITPSPTLTPTPSVTPKPSPTPAPTGTPTPVGPAFVLIRSNFLTMTDTQWNHYAESLRGVRIEGWEGVVSEVDEGEILGGHTVYVDMDRGGVDVFIDVSESVALTLNLNQRIIFSGTISSASGFLGLSISIRDAEIELAKTDG